MFVLCLWRFAVTHGLLLKYILSHGIGIDGFFTFFGGFLNQGFTIEMNNWTSKLTKPAQGQKNTSFEFQSAPNLHRDKKNKSFELQSAPNLHRDKKNKKNKNFRGILAPSQVDWKVFVFFLFCLSLCRFGALWSSRLLFFLSLCRFVALWSSKLVFFCPCAGLVRLISGSISVWYVPPK